ncbi:MAG TPA: FKBP-type peptidyl-prolyl cis-trans isomerase [Verrucomicrobiae bacterium]|nr:FKBP-type peptidyl-prolyl cis-trans isomerase [Verrucomicrobiae bacterium]
MARLRERIFAGFGAILFLGSACALTVFVILQPGSDTTNTTNTASNQTQSTCDINTPVSDTAEATPAPYEPSGAITSLQITDLTVGTGTAAKNGDCLVMKYQGNLASNGTVFDENYSKAQALQFTLGQGEVIPGWDQGLVGMKVGGTRRLVIPASLGYGSTAQGSIPANSNLVFIVKLEKITNG